MPSRTSTYDDFYAEHFTPLAVQLYAYAGDLATAEAVAQEACCRVLARWATLDDPEGWLWRTAWSLARSRVGRARARRAHGGVVRPRPASALQAGYVKALAAVPSRPRRVFVLHHLGGMTLADICDLERIRVARVRTALARAQARFTATMPNVSGASATGSAAVPTGSAAVPAGAAVPEPVPDPATLPPPADPFAGLEYSDPTPSGNIKLPPKPAKDQPGKDQPGTAQAGQAGRAGRAKVGRGKGNGTSDGSDYQTGLADA